MSKEIMFIAACDSFLSHKQSVTKTILTTSSFFAENGKAAKNQVSKIFGCDQFVAEMDRSRSQDSATLIPTQSVTGSSVYGVAQFVADHEAFRLIAPSVDAFNYVKGKEEVGIQTEVEGAFNKRETVFFWG